MIPETGFLRLHQIIGRPARPAKPGDPTAQPPKRPRLAQPAIDPIVPVGKTTLYGWVRDGKFPEPTKLPGNVSAWRSEWVREWLARQGAE